MFTDNTMYREKKCYPLALSPFRFLTRSEFPRKEGVLKNTIRI